MSHFVTCKVNLVYCVYGSTCIQGTVARSSCYSGNVEAVVVLLLLLLLLWLLLLYPTTTSSTTTTTVNLFLPVIRWRSSGKSRSQQQVKAVYPGTYHCCVQCSLVGFSVTLWPTGHWEATASF